MVPYWVGQSPSQGMFLRNTIKEFEFLELCVSYMRIGVPITQSIKEKIVLIYLAKQVLIIFLTVKI